MGARRELLTEADITPHRSLLPKMGASGYSFPEAVAELADNAIEWRVPGDRVTIGIDVSADKVEVTDDAQGMDATRLASAMKLAYRDGLSEAHTKLSQFGLGMKTAASSLGRRFKVASTVAGTTSRFEVVFDEDEWASGDGFAWRLPVYEVKRGARKDAHGTTVTITGLHYRPTNRVTDLRRDFAQRYATFLENGEAAIRVNTRWVAPERPDVEAGTERSFELDVDGDRVHGWFGLLAEGSQKGYYGWETKRRGRTITMHDKRFGLREHPEFLKVAGVIHLDFLNVSHNKTAWIEDDRFARLQDVLAEELRPRIRELVGEEKRARLEARTRVAVTRWVSAMADVGSGETSPQSGREEKRTLERWHRKYPAPSTTHADGSSPTRDADAEAPPDAPEKPSTPRVRVGRVRLSVDHRFHPMGQDGPWMAWGVRDDGTLEVFTNEEFPAFHAAEDKAFYAALHVAEAIARLATREDRNADPDAVRERVLRGAAVGLLAADANAAPA